MFGQPNYEFVIKLNDSEVRGWCPNFNSIPHALELKIERNKFEFIHNGIFEPIYWFMNYKKIWNQCTKSRYEYFKQHHNTTKITLKFIS